MKPGILILLMMCMGLTQGLQAQCLPTPAGSCFDPIPLVCELDGYCGETDDATSSSGSVNCGAFGVELYGMQVVQFVASDNDLQLRIDYSNCDGVVQPGGGTAYGITALLLGGCPTDGSGAFDCDQSLAQNGFVSIDINDAVPGEYYTLALIGYLGNVCSFDITVISGADPLPGLFPSGNEIEGPTSACPNDIYTYFAPEVDGAEYYLFSLSTGQFQETDVPEIEIEWDESLPDTTYTLCVSAFNQCESLIDYACIDVEFGAGAEIEYEAVLCPGESLEAFGDVFPAPGEYVVEINNPDGCDSIVFITLEVYDAPEVIAAITPDDGSGNGAIELTVTGDGPFEYEWSNNGSSTASITDLPAGIYTVTITDANSCETVVDFEVEMGTASVFLVKANRIPVSPNPALTGQSLFIQADDLEHIASIAYVNMQGQVVWKNNAVHAVSSRLELPSINVPGLYQVRMIAGDGKLSIGRVTVLEKQ